MRRGCGRRTGAGGGGGAGEKGGTGGCLRSGPRRLSLHPKEVPRASLAAPQNLGRAALRQAARTQSRGRTPAQNPPCFQVFTCAGPGPGVKVIGVRGALETRRNPLETAYERHKSPCEGLYGLPSSLLLPPLTPASSVAATGRKRFAVRYLEGNPIWYCHGLPGEAASRTRGQQRAKETCENFFITRNIQTEVVNNPLSPIRVVPTQANG